MARRDIVPSPNLPALTAVPAARSRAAVLKVRFYTLLAALVLSSTVGVFATIAWLTFQPPQVDVRDANPRGRAIAELAAASYLAGDGLYLPAGPGNAPRAAVPVETLTAPVWERYQRFFIGTLPVESHRFLFQRAVAAENGSTSAQLMVLTVLVGVPDGGTPFLASRPQFAPAPYGDSELPTDYSDFETAAQLPGNAVSQLRNWGTAWAADDSERLKLLTGDQTAGVRYVGLGGYRLSELRIITALPVDVDKYVVRVRIVVAGANESILEMDMDVTVINASTGLPNVIGWGPAGSGVVAPDDVRVAAE